MNDTAEQPVYKFPKTAGACVDKLYALDAARAKAQAKADAIKDEFKALENYLLATLPKADLDGAMGRVAKVKIISSFVPHVEDWTKLRAYIKRTNGWDLMQQRLSSTAFRERWNAKKIVPGVSQFKVLKLSLTKKG